MMRVSTVLLALAVAASAAAPSVWSQTAAVPAPALPSAGDILARHRDAVGGEAAIRKHRSRRVTGHFALTAQGIEGPLEMLAAAPDRLVLRMDVGGLGRIERGYDGSIGWSIDPGVGPRLLEGRELSELRYSADFYSDLKDFSDFESATVLERTTFEGKDCYAVRLVRPDGMEITEYYDVSSGLLAGSRMDSTSAMGRIPTTSVVDEYREFDGVLLPTRARQRAMGVEWLLTIASVEHDVVPDGAFVPPPAIAALRDRQRAPTGR
ncbi:MAG TPA: hypothetical protein VNK41_01465 [Vicinamibacterales bacterium]|nr:hypothetical protein [Vicinamibacterales bacterium]